MNALARLTHLKRSKYIVNKITACYSLSAVPVDKWKGILNSAEKVVGYPTSFLSLRWLLNDEVSNIALHVTKLIGTKHPIIKLARNLLEQTDSPKWGLIVLLISKAAGIKSKTAEIEKDIACGILHNQRALAEITEMIRTGHNLHNGIMHVDEMDQDCKDLKFGNKIALLSGDYLYSKSFQELALLKNYDLNEIISTSLRDLAESEYIQPRDAENNPLPSVPCSEKQAKLLNTDPGPYNFEDYLGNAREEWILRNLLSGVNLLAKSCRGALALGNHPVLLQENAYIFGRSLALAMKANEEIKPFVKNSTLPFEPVYAPVLFELQSDPQMYKLLQSFDTNQVEIRESVVKGVGIEKSYELQLEFIDEALNALHYFPESDARDSLTKMVKALEY